MSLISLVRTNCPKCDSDNVYCFDEGEFDEQYASQGWRCGECEIKWTEVYVHSESYDG